MTRKFYRKDDNFNPYFIYGALFRLQRIYKNKDLHFLIFVHDERLSQGYKEVKISNNITYVYLNNMWQDEKTFSQYGWRGNKECVIQYLKEHICLTEEKITFKKPKRLLFKKVKFKNGHKITRYLGGVVKKVKTPTSKKFYLFGVQIWSRKRH